MGDFFHRWRRKAGCVMLVMACVLTLGWVRSCQFEEGFGFYTKDSIIGFTSNYRGLTWSRCVVQRFDSGGYWELWDAQPKSPFDYITDEYEGLITVWRRAWGGFDFGDCHEEFEARRLIRWTIPYWSIVLPLTLISGWLLLSKSRKKLTPTNGEVSLKPS
jgi:hypothetical protein